MSRAPPLAPSRPPPCRPPRRRRRVARGVEGVGRTLSRAFGLAPPASSSRTHCSWPPRAASCKGVQSDWSGAAHTTPVSASPPLAPSRPAPLRQRAPGSAAALSLGAPSPGPHRTRPHAALPPRSPARPSERGQSRGRGAARGPCLTAAPPPPQPPPHAAAYPTRAERTESFSCTHSGCCLRSRSTAAASPLLLALCKSVFTISPVAGLCLRRLALRV